MAQMVPLNKRSKKAQKEYHTKQRGSWYGIVRLPALCQVERFMTEIELNRKIAELLKNSEEEFRCKRYTGRRYRRRKGREKSDRLLAIIQSARYGPHRGYVDWGFEGRTLLHTGKYIKYPKNSKCQKWLKRVSNKKVRAYPYLPQKGNGYRKVFDYWWTLY